MDATALGRTMSQASLYYPIPGKAGVADIILREVYTSILGSAELGSQVAYIERFVGYYGKVFFTFIPFTYTMLTIKKK